MSREKCGLLAGPQTVPVSWKTYPSLSLSPVSYYGYSADASPKLHMYFLQGDNVLQVTTALWTVNLWLGRGGAVMYSAWNPKYNYDMCASVFVVQFNGFMSLTS